MNVTVDVAGEDPRDVVLADDATYADLLGSVGLSPHEASVLVDGRTVPVDQPVDAERVRVVRLIKGG